MAVWVKTDVCVCVCMDLYNGGLWREWLGAGIALGKDQFSDCEGRDGEHWSAFMYLHVVSAL